MIDQSTVFSASAEEVRELDCLTFNQKAYLDDFLKQWEKADEAFRSTLTLSYQRWCTYQQIKHDLITLFQKLTLDPNDDDDCMLDRMSCQIIYKDLHRAIVQYDEGASPFLNFIDLDEKKIIKTMETGEIFDYIKK